MVRIEFIVQGDDLYGPVLHEHQNWELIYSLNGTHVLKYGEKRIVYKPYHGVVIPPHIEHLNDCISDDSTLIRLVFDSNVNNTEYTEPIPFDDSLDKDLGSLLQMCAKYFSYGPIMQNQEIIDSYSILIGHRLTELIKFSNRSPMVLEIAKDIINNFTNPDYSLDDVFDNYHLSKDYIRRQFIKEQGISPIQFLTNTRISHAMNLLRTRYLNRKKINEIAVESGFSDQLYFSRVFHKIVGCSPREYSDSNKSLEP